MCDSVRLSVRIGEYSVSLAQLAHSNPHQLLKRDNFTAVTANMSKQEQVLILDPPSDLKFKGKHF